MLEPQEMQVRSLGWEDLLEEELTTHSKYSYLENVTRTDECGGLQSMVSQSVGHNWATENELWSTGRSQNGEH